MRLVAPVPARVPSALLRNGWSGSFLVGPWSEPGGASSQSSMFDCQPKLAEANGGMGLSAQAVPAASITVVDRQTAKVPADSATKRYPSATTFFDRMSGMVSSLAEPSS